MSVEAIIGITLAVVGIGLTIAYGQGWRPFGGKAAEVATPEELEPEDLEVVTGIVVNNRHVLMVHRRAKPDEEPREATAQLTWQFPSGTVDATTVAPKEQLKIELEQETALNCSVGELISQRDHPISGKRIGYFACEKQGGTVFNAQPDENSAIAWVAIDDLTTFVTSGIDATVKAHLDARRYGFCRVAGSWS
jgi:8-oxo-dGTP diphosphatase